MKSRIGLERKKNECLTISRIDSIIKSCYTNEKQNWIGEKKRWVFDDKQNILNDKIMQNE